jgi:hypothetical protein
MEQKQKTLIVEYDMKFGESMKISLEQKGYPCDLFTDVQREEPKDGLVVLHQRYGGTKDVVLADYAVVFIVSVRAASVSPEKIVSCWKGQFLCCIGASVIDQQRLLVAGVEFVVDPEQERFERFLSIWFGTIYEKACSEHNSYHMY